MNFLDLYPFSVALNVVLLISLSTMALYFKLRVCKLEKAREVVCGNAHYWRNQLDLKKQQLEKSNNELRQSLNSKSSSNEIVDNDTQLLK